MPKSGVVIFARSAENRSGGHCYFSPWCNDVTLALHILEEGSSHFGRRKRLEIFGP
jgi:hypothetical protein